MKKRDFDIIVIGGGAAGLMAAVCAARDGAKTAVLDHARDVGLKLLSTGNGRCNLSNAVCGPDQYRASDPAFVETVLAAFSNRDAVSFFEDGLQVPVREKRGYYYPRSNQAATVREAFLRTADRFGISILRGVEVEEILPPGQGQEGFRIQTDKGRFFAGACILACGGKSYPKTGSDGKGYALAKGLGHMINKPLPALVPLYTSTSDLADLAGVRAEGRISLYRLPGMEAGRERDQDPLLLARDRGELQFTDYGISGIPAFQVSGYAAVPLLKRQNLEAIIDLVPEMDARAFEDYLQGQCLSLGQERDAYGRDRAVLAHLFYGFFPKKIARHLLQAEDPVAKAKCIRLPIRKTGGFSQAQVTTGGIMLSEIDPASMGSRIVAGLYFAGEMMDVDGLCGGYNLQWAWSTGYVAGRSAADYVKKRRYEG